MVKAEKIQILAEIMDIDAGLLIESAVLADFEEWDSLSVLSFVSTLSEKFGKTLSFADVKKIVTVSDALKLME